MPRSVEGKIGIQDNFSATMRKIRSTVTDLRKETEQTREELTRTWGQEYEVKLDAEGATSKTLEMQNQLKKLDSQNATPTASVKDRATDKIKSIFGKGKELGGKIFSPIVAVKDFSTGVLKTLLKSFKTLTAGIMIPVMMVAAPAAALSGMVWKEGMQAQLNRTQIQHFIDVGNPKNAVAKNLDLGAAYQKELRAMASGNKLFDYGDLMKGGAEAISISDGDTKKALEYLRVAQDMAALSPGKTLEQALEALRGAKTGKAGSLDDFNIDVTAEEVKDLGLDALIKERIKPIVSGGAMKMGNTSQGYLTGMRNIGRNVLTTVGIGAIQNLEPALAKVYGLLEGAAPKLSAFGVSVTDNMGKAVVWAIDTLEQNAPRINAIFDNLGAMAQVLAPVAMTVGQTLLDIGIKAAPVVDGLMGIATVVLTHLGPAFAEIYQGMGGKIGSTLQTLGEQMPWLKQVMEQSLPLITDMLRTLWSVADPIIDGAIEGLQGLFNLAKAGFPAFQGTISGTWAIVKPILAALALMLREAANAMAAFNAARGGGFGAGVRGSSGLVYSAPSGAEGIGSNASGTDFWRGGLTQINEDGPEIVNLPRGSQIIPHKESMRILAGGGRSNNIVVQKFADQIVVQKDSDIDAIGAAFARHLMDSLQNLSYPGEGVPA